MIAYKSAHQLAKLIKDDLNGNNDQNNLPKSDSDIVKLNEIKKLDDLIRSVLNIQNESCSTCWRIRNEVIRIYNKNP